MQRPVTTINYAYLEDSVKTSHEAFIVANVTSYPQELVNRCKVLLGAFLEEYIHGDVDFNFLIYSLRLGGATVIAQLESIHEQLLLADMMLSECQTYKEGD